MHRVLAIGLLSLLVGGLPLHGSEPSAVVPWDGKPFQASLAAATADWQLQFGGDKGREMSAAEVVQWGSFRDAVREPLALMRDGGVLVGDIVALDHENLHVRSNLFGDIRFPRDRIFGVLLHPPTADAIRDQLALRVLASEGKTDRIVLNNGDELTGSIASLAGQVLSLQREAGKLNVELSKVSHLIFKSSAPSRAGRPGLRAMVGFDEGSRVLAGSLVADGKQAVVKTMDQVELISPVHSLVALQPLGGKVTYVSDLRPASYRHIPFLSIAWPFRGDRSVLGSQLRCDGKLVLKGIGMHSASRLTYDLDAAYRRMDAELGIDDETHGKGSVLFCVFVDEGNSNWQPKYTSPIVRGGEPPIAMSVDLTGAKRVSLLVEYADRGDELDHADWLNARLIR